MNLLFNTVLRFWNDVKEPFLPLSGVKQKMMIAFYLWKIKIRYVLEKNYCTPFNIKARQVLAAIAKNTRHACVFRRKWKRQTKQWLIQPTSLLAVCISYWRDCPVFVFILSHQVEEIKLDFSCIAQVKFCRSVCIPRCFISKFAFWKVNRFFLCECNKNKCFFPGNFGGGWPAFQCFLNTETPLEIK